MPRPTARGLALLGFAAASYVAGRVVGTWELYFFAFAFAAAVVIAWILLVATGQRVVVTRLLQPERPVAGDKPLLRLMVRNRSWLPGPELTLHILLAGLGPEDIETEVGSLAPRAQQLITIRLDRVLRGLHRLPAIKATAEDPLGLATATRRVSNSMVVTVHPRLALLESCALYPQTGLRFDWGGRHAVPFLGAAEFRGIRPHQPGEPLSRIDWKSTARTGTLMLRETEEPAGSEVTVLLDGSATSVVGEMPHSNYELALQAAGSVADFALRAGRGVNLLRHERELQRIKLSPDAGGRIRLLDVLAAACPDSHAPLRQSLLRLRTQSVTVVTLSLDRQLMQTLVALAEEGVHLTLLHVVGRDFSGAAAEAAAPLLPFLPPRPPHETEPFEAGRSVLRDPPDWEGPRGHDRRSPGYDRDAPLSPEDRSSMLRLAAAGVISVTLRRGDDLGQVLSLGRNPRQSRFRRS